MQLVMLCNVEATANESRWGLMSGGEAGSGAQTLDSSFSEPDFHLPRSGAAPCFKKKPLRDLSVGKGRKLRKAITSTSPAVLSLWN